MKLLSLPDTENRLLGRFLLPWVVVLHLTGGYPRLVNWRQWKSHSSHVFEIIQTTWCCVVLLTSSAVGILTVMNAPKNDFCRAEQLVKVVGDNFSEVILRIGFFLLIFNIQPLVEVDCRRLDMILSKYYSRRDKTILKIAMSLLVALTGIQTALMFILYFKEEASQLHEKLLEVSHYMSSRSGAMVSWMICPIDYMAGIAKNCGQLLIAIACICLAVCFKRLRQQLPVGSHGSHAASPTKQPGSRMRDLLYEHSQLCDLMEDIGSKISGFVFICTCVDALKIVQYIFDAKIGRFHDHLEAYSIYMTVRWFSFIFRTAALIYLSDQVCTVFHWI